MSELEFVSTDHIASAIDQEDLAKLTELYTQCPDVFLACAFSAAQKNALHYAAHSGKLYACECLLSLGADINRIHLMTHKTPLELSRMWRLPEIEELLLQKGAKGRLSSGDMTGTGSGVLMHASRLGHVLPVVLKGEERVQLRVAVINKGKQKLLFTVGLSAFTNPKIEINMVLPVEWNFYDTQSENHFPVDLLWNLAAQIQNGEQIDETCLISRLKEPYCRLTWPAGTAGFYPADVAWGLHKEGVELKTPVKLLSLLPVKQAKKMPPLDVQKNRSAKWARLTLKLPHKL